MFGRRHKTKPMPKWAAILAGLMFATFGVFFTVAIVAGEVDPSAPILARLAAGAIALGLIAAGALVVTSTLRK